MAEHRIDFRIDGHPYAVLVEAEDEAAARAAMSRDWSAGLLCEYRTVAGGTVTIRWSKVATLEIG